MNQTNQTVHVPTLRASIPVPQVQGEDEGLIDMTRTMAPDVPGFRDVLRTALQEVGDNPELSYLIQRHRFFGSDSERTSVANWLGCRLGKVPAIEQLMITGGTQNCLELLIPRLARPGEALATETLSYAATPQICRLYGVNVVGVEIDREGLIPESFEAACRKTAVRVLYCNPTMHNPTTSILPEPRRRQIAEIARRHGVTIIEDDVHGKLIPEAPFPIATFAPDITWYIMSVSKCLGMGLRAAVLVGPSEEAIAQVRSPIQSISSWFVPGVSAALLKVLIDKGWADDIAVQMRHEIAARQAIARDALAGQVVETKTQSLHLWLGLPDAWTVADLVKAAALHGVGIRPSDLFNAGGGKMPNFVRLSMVAPRTRDDLAYAVRTIGSLLKGRPG